MGKGIEGTLVKRKGRVVAVYQHPKQGIRYEEGNRLEIGTGWLQGQYYAIEGETRAFYEELERKGRKVYYWEIEHRGAKIKLKTKALGQGIYRTTLSLPTEHIESTRYIEVLHGLYVDKYKERKHINKKVDAIIQKFYN